MRRFYELKTLIKIDWDVINAIDYAALWCGIDENKEGGYLKPFLAEIRSIQEEMAETDPIKEFILESRFNTSSQEIGKVSVEFLHRCYVLWWQERIAKPKELAWFSRQDKYAVRVLSVDVATKSINNEWQFFSANPMHTKRLDVNVTTFRNILIEIDSIPVEEQFSFIEQIEMPYSTAGYSGRKSIHYIIALDLPLSNRPEYDNVVKKITGTATSSSPFGSLVPVQVSGIFSGLL